MTRHTAKHDALLDELLKDYTDPKDILGEHGLLRQLTKRLVERAAHTRGDYAPRV
jgi:putative transposase